METLFSYGTLQIAETQLATFGRTLSGEPDELPGYRLTSLTIGVDIYRNIEPTGRESDFVAGTRLKVTREELANADAYEADADYERIRVVLRSGAEAWVYLARRSG